MIVKSEPRFVFSVDVAGENFTFGVFAPSEQEAREKLKTILKVFLSSL